MGQQNNSFYKVQFGVHKVWGSIKFCLQRVLGFAVILDNVAVLLCKYKVIFLFGGITTLRYFMDWKEYLKQIVSLSWVIGPTKVNHCV